MPEGLKLLPELPLSARVPDAVAQGEPEALKRPLTEALPVSAKEPVKLPLPLGEPVPDKLSK